ncbi:MAG: deoxynucleoside kinase [Acholeplasma sp.]|nr:deoxynucleoside kinase [Acholeplasma sp.]
MLVVVGGMIGLGKTTMAELISKELKGKVYYEAVDNNPILPLYYTASDEEIQKMRYPFLLQLFFLNSRYKTIKEASLNACNNLSVIDRSIYEDWYFAKVNYDLGRMNNLEFEMYKLLLDNMMEEIKDIPKKAPDLMVYLDGSFETVLSRIKKRGRSFEISPDLLSYYQTLWNGYGDWLRNFYKASDVLIIDMDKYDVVNNKNDKDTVLSLINDKLSSLKK